MKIMTDIDFTKLLNDSLRIFYKDAVRTALTNPSQARFFIRTLNWQNKAAKIRSRWKMQGIHIPPILVFSVTNQCNLHCQGCYHRALRDPPSTEMSADQICQLVAESKELGISFIVFGGGEPLMRREILDITEKYPEILFLMFTNGLLIDEGVIKRLKKQKNFIPLISLEGFQRETDGRRGAGVYRQLQKTLADLKANGVFWGTSLTLTRMNFPTATDEKFIKGLVDQGCKFFMLVEYTPIKEGTEDWVITEQQRASLHSLRESFRSKYSAMFIALPADEEEIGGCLSAGRGFVHISAEGDLEPCPFIPYSDTNLNHATLKQALQSKFLETIRNSHSQLHETGGGCALWARREWVQSLAKGEP
jgi:MoaA/NifB/PqqE/SkfB family radical SAM enzyme